MLCRRWSGIGPFLFADRQFLLRIATDAETGSEGASAYQGSKTAQLRLNNHLMVEHGKEASPSLHFKSVKVLTRGRVCWHMQCIQAV